MMPSTRTEDMVEVEIEGNDGPVDLQDEEADE